MSVFFCTPCQRMWKAFLQMIKEQKSFTIWHIAVTGFLILITVEKTPTSASGE